MLTDFEDLPILGTLTRCEHTKTGWRGIHEDGTIRDVTYRPGTNVGYIARMPENNRVIALDGDGRRIGVWLLERKRKRARDLSNRPGNEAGR